MGYTLAGLAIDDRCLEFRYVRGAGPGGQNVNKVATAAQLRFHFMDCDTLSHAVRTRLSALAGQRLAGGTDILIVAREHRTQDQNRSAALRRLEELLQRAQHVPKIRRPTKPGRAARERRLDHKTQAGKRKKMRARVDAHD
jgi:ribosome-associated protein